jgi:hypothetical protein
VRVTRGTVLVGTRDGRVLEVQSGQTVYAPPGEEHWHGATPECWMEHLAMLENADDPAATTSWFEHVTEAQHGARRWFRPSEGASQRHALAAPRPEPAGARRTWLGVSERRAQVRAVDLLEELVNTDLRC